MSQPPFIHPSSVVDDGAQLEDGVKIWHFCHVSSGATLGANSSLGQNVFVASDVEIGSNVKIQNNVSIYAGTKIDDDVFLGPSCVLTNVSNPRSQVVRRGIYEETHIQRGATIGANATIVCGVTIGRYAFVAAGAVVTKSLRDYQFVRGVPGRHVGWMSRHGHELRFDGQGDAICPESGLRYKLVDSGSEGSSVRCLDIDEDAPMPAELATGEVSYRNVKRT